jgi:hypothetical protein
VPRCFGYSPCPHRGDRPPRRHGFLARGSYSHFELSHFDGPHFPRRGSHPTRSNGEVQRIVKISLIVWLSTSLGSMVKCWIPKVFLTNPNTELSTFSHSM